MLILDVHTCEYKFVALFSCCIHSGTFTFSFLVLQIWLSLDHNKLEMLPPEIGQLTRLGWLSIENNFLQSLPYEIGNLKSLQGLSVLGNRLVEPLTTQVWGEETSGRLKEIHGWREMRRLNSRKKRREIMRVHRSEKKRYIHTTNRDQMECSLEGRSSLARASFQLNNILNR